MCFWPVGEIGQGAVLDLAFVAERLAQENARGRIAVGNRLDMATNITKKTPSEDKEKHPKIHGYILGPKIRSNQVLEHFNGRSPDRSSG
jgi:hypothetical protein